LKKYPYAKDKGQILSLSIEDLYDLEKAYNSYNYTYLKHLFLRLNLYDLVSTSYLDISFDAYDTVSSQVKNIKLANYNDFFEILVVADGFLKGNEDFDFIEQQGSTKDRIFQSADKYQATKYHYRVYESLFLIMDLFTFYDNINQIYDYLNYNDFMTNVDVENDSDTFFYFNAQYDEYDNLKAKLYRLLTRYYKWKSHLAKRHQYGSIVAFFDSVSSYFRSNVLLEHFKLQQQYILNTFLTKNSQELSNNNSFIKILNELNKTRYELVKKSRITLRIETNKTYKRRKTKGTLRSASLAYSNDPYSDIDVEDVKVHDDPIKEEDEEVDEEFQNFLSFLFIKRPFKDYLNHKHFLVEELLHNYFFRGIFRHNNYMHRIINPIKNNNLLYTNYRDTYLGLSYLNNFELITRTKFYRTIELNSTCCLGHLDKFYASDIRTTTLNSKLPYFYYGAKNKTFAKRLNLRYQIITRIAEQKEKFIEFYIKYPLKLTREQQIRNEEREALERTWRFRLHKLYCYLLRKSTELYDYIESFFTIPHDPSQ
jgi:hypothetical protein